MKIYKFADLKKTPIQGQHFQTFFQNILTVRISIPVKPVIVLLCVLCVAWIFPSLACDIAVADDMDGLPIPLHI